MKIRKIAAISLLVFSSFAANTVAPSKSELEAMYDKAFREFDGNNYEQALKDLDAIDARQPDLAESQNLRGVILMRQKDYVKAEAALQRALAADPKFWNARFNLAEIPFLQKNWSEARKRFQDLLTGNASELQGEATQLIQYKVLITYLMEGKEDMVDAIKGKFELAPETPALQYALASIALKKKDENAAKEALATAEKNFSPQLNRLFAESLYEVGWLEKPVGQTRAALELNSAAERGAKTKEFAKAKSDEAEQALQQHDLTAARKLIDEADAADPNRAATINLRGEIFLEQKDWDQAESEFKKALKIDPKLRDAQYNLAQVPFKKKEYGKARERFEALFNATSGADKDRAAQLIKFKVYMTYLLEGKDSRAQKMMEQFQFTGDTPALYYAQAAWEFKHDNPSKANDWVTSARKIYSPALNTVFSDAFFDLDWLQAPAAEASSSATVAEANQPELAPSIEPTPIPSITLAKNDVDKGADPLTLAAQPDASAPGIDGTTTSAAEGSPAPSIVVGAAASPSVETPVASTASPAAAQPVIASTSEPEAPPTSAETVSNSHASTAVASASPATVLAPEKVREWSKPSIVLLLVAILLLAWVVIPQIRRLMARRSVTQTLSSAPTPRLAGNDEAVGAVEHFATPARLAGGPPQVSLHLRPSEPALRRAVMLPGKNGRGSGSGAAVAAAAVAAPVETSVPPEKFVPAVSESFTEGVGEPLFEGPREPNEFLSEEVAEPVAFDEPAPVEAFATEPLEAEFVEAPMEVAEPVAFDEPAPAGTFATEPLEAEFVEAPMEVAEPVAFDEPAPAETFATEPAEAEFVEAPMKVVEPIWETVGAIEEPHTEEAMAFAEEARPAFAEFAASPIMTGDWMAEATTSMDEASEPIGQGQPIPHLIPATSADEPVAQIPEQEVEMPVADFAAVLAGLGALSHSLDKPSFAAQDAFPEPTAQQSTQPATMSQSTPTTPVPTIRTGPATPMTGGAPPMQPASAPFAAPQTGAMHTAVQLTFSFEITSLQLTPNFKMGAVQLKPTSKIVTMRLAPSQHPQPAMNLQITFEVASVQLNGNSIGMIRLTPSQQQRPSITNSSSFNIAGLQLVSGSEAAPVQMTPSQQGQASVHVTAGFQIATVEFSPSFEIASIILNATSKNASVQLPGTGPSALEGAPVFEIANVQLGGNGEITGMQLNPRGAALKSA